MAADEYAVAGDFRRLQSFLTQEEISLLPIKEASKINSYINERNEEFIKTKALLETEKYRMETKILESEKKNSELILNYENTVRKLTLAEDKIIELQSEVNATALQLESSHEKYSELENEIKNLKTSGEILLDEKNEMVRALERQTAEFKRLKVVVENTSLELHVAKEANCEVLSLNDEYHNKEIILRQNEKKLEQERGVYSAKILALTEELNRVTTDLQSANINSTKKVLQLEANVKELTEKLDAAYANVNQMMEEKDKVNSQNEDLLQKLTEQSSLANKLSTNFTKELDIKSKTFDLYKTLQDSAEMKAMELVNGVATLQKLLDQATERYGELETKFKESELQHKEALQKRDEIISTLNTELKHANELLLSNATENVDSENDTSEIMREALNSGFSITQLYTQLENVKSELTKEKAECKRLTMALNDVVREVEIRVPNFERTKDKLDEAMESNRVLTQQLDSLGIEYVQLKHDLTEATQKVKMYNKENIRLKMELDDLGNQICHLLKAGQNMSYNANLSSPANEALTFSNIQELQRNNQKLIRNLKELSEKCEHLETLKHQFDSADYQNKIKLLESKVCALTQTQERQTKYVTELIRQRDLYKNLCHDNKNIDISMIDSSGNKDNKLAPSIASEKSSIEEELRKTEKELENLKEEYRAYKEIKDTTEKKLKDDLISLQQELKSTKASNAVTTAHNKEQVKHLQSVISGYKNKIAALEEGKMEFHSTISKHEFSIRNLQIELNKSQQKVESAEAIAERYKSECNKILQSYKMHFTETSISLEGQKNNEILSENLELLKSQLQASNDSYAKLELRYHDVRRECEIARRNLEEEQKEFSEMKTNLIKAAEDAMMHLREEKKLTEVLKIELSELKNPNNKSNFNTGNVKDTTIEDIIKDKDYQIKILQDELKSSQKSIVTYGEISHRAEESFKILQEEYIKYKTQIEQTLTEQKEKTQGLQNRCSELEAELSLQIMEDNTPALQDQLTNAENQLKETQESLDNCKMDLNGILIEKSDLSKALQNMEQQYNELMALHTNDIQKLNQCNEEILKLQNKLQDMVSVKDRIITEMENKEKSWKVKEEALMTETKDLQTQIDEINTQRNLLLDQLQSMSAQLSLQMTLQSMHSSDNKSTISTTLDNVELCPGALNEIITFMRKDKEAISAKCVTLQSELSRVKIQLKSTEEQLHNTRLQLEKVMTNTTSTNSDKRGSSNTSIDVVSESNRYLQSERDNLKARNKTLSDSIKSLEVQLSQLQEINSELKSKNDDLETINESLRDEVVRWKKNNKTNVDRASKTNAEDYKRLQNEKDQYMKSLAAEKESVKKLIEELSSAKREKIKTDEENSMLSRQHAMVVEDHKRLNSELLKAQENLSKVTQECVTLKSDLTLKTKANSSLLKVIAEKEDLLTEIKHKEQQVRKVAKRYKNVNEDNLKIIEENNNKLKAQEEQIEGLQSQLKALKMDVESSLEKEEKAKQLLKTAKSKITNLIDMKVSLTKELEDCQAKIKSFEQGSTDEQISIIKTYYEEQLSKLEKEKEDTSTENAKEVDELTQKIDILQQQLTTQSNTKQQPSSEKPMSPPTANIKPMASCSGASTSSIRRSGEPPLASIRPVAQVQCLVQPVHDAHSTEYMPASSSRSVSRAAPPESTQGSDDSQPPQQTVATVTPRVEAQVAPVSGQSGVSTSNAPEQRAQKRPCPPLATFPQLKKSRIDEEYQVPTSSQRDQDDEGVVIVESDEECTGTQYMEAGDEDEEEALYAEEQMGENGDDEHDPEASEDEGTEESSEEEVNASEAAAPQIEAISSGTEPSGALSLGVGDDGDDGIVPSTPTLYVPRRNDGFGEAVVSPLSGADATAVPSGARFTFAEAGEASHHDTHADLTSALPPSMPEDWAPAVTSNQTEPTQMIEEGREAEASSDEARRIWPRDEGESTEQADGSTY